MVWILIVVVGAAADQLIKAWLSGALVPESPLWVIDGFFSITLRTNTGAAWSLFAGSEAGRIALAAISALASLAMLAAILLYPDRRVKACLAFLCAGSVGNLVDRIRTGRVIDFLDFHFGSYVFPTFNLADMMIVCSSIALGIVVLFARDLPSPGVFLKRRAGAGKGGDGT